jgi:hypothetical protein
MKIPIVYGLLFSLFSLIVFTACTAAPDATSDLADSDKLDWQATPQASQTQNHANRATITALRTETGQAQLTSQDPTPTASPHPVVPTPTLEMIVHGVSISTSPDGEWKAETLMGIPYDPERKFMEALGYAMKYERLTVYRVDGSQIWTPYEEWTETGMGDSSLSGIYWPANGRYLYFVHKGATHPCGNTFVTNLRRFDLHDGDLDEIPLIGLGLGDVAIPSGADLLVYRTEEGMLAYDLESGSSRTYQYQWPENSIVDFYGWSPDSKRVAFNLIENYCDFDEEYHSSILVFDLGSGTVRKVSYMVPETMPFVIGWPEPDKLKVYLDGEYFLDLDTGALTLDTSQLDPVSIAHRILQDYLNSLYWDDNDIWGIYNTEQYEEAARLYGGSYDMLIEMNPDIDPNDRAALLLNACQVNGYQCLRLLEVLSSEIVEGEDDALEIGFTVNLMNWDDSVFALGPCCGEEIVEDPRTEFQFTVRQVEDGSFKVLELPTYMP